MSAIDRADLLILGASARSAAFSALRLSLRPVTGDLFADADLTMVCPATRVDPSTYPDGLAEFASRLEPTPWLYTGALENYPDLVDRVSLNHPLLGNPGDVLRGVRDPFAVTGAIREAGLVAPGVRADSSGLPLDGSWLVKPILSGGGRGIRPWNGSTLLQGRSVYYQERIAGLSLSAVFVAEATGTRCVGITRQFVGKPGNRFAYRGSLGPWPVTVEVQRQVERLGLAIGSHFGLVGLFGVDLVLRDDQIWPIEVNPRYTASVEILEWALGRSLLAEHMRACERDVELPPILKWHNDGYVAKAIIYAERSCRWSMGLGTSMVDFRLFPTLADFPRAGTRFRAGEPVMTVFARGNSPEQCRRNLASRLLTWRGVIRSRTT